MKPSTPAPTATPPATGTLGGLGAFLDGLRSLDADGLQAVITAAKSALKKACCTETVQIES